jgi:hypothetical protein
LFPKQKSGFIVPLKRHFKLTQLSNDLGAMAFLQEYPPNLEHFVLLNGDGTIPALFFSSTGWKI